MSAALAEAIKGTPSPNPHVGAVLVRDGEVVGRGYHPKPGREHAEVMAIRDAGARARGATLYVTLEPCNHHGKTPPCSEAIIASGIKRVVYATTDPNPVAQGGAERLRAAGIEVETIDDSQARFANRDWLTKIRLGRPRFVWKVAASLDGAIAAQDGSSKWITNDASRADVKRERSLADAILTGTGTVIADDPSLLGESINPIRIVMGERQIPASAKILAGGVETIQLKTRDLDRLIDLVNERGFNRIFVESGPILGTALFKAGLIDEVLLYQAPTLLGSDRRFTKGISISEISKQIRLTSEEIQEFAGDIRRLFFTDSEINKELSCLPA